MKEHTRMTVNMEKQEKKLFSKNIKFISLLILLCPPAVPTQIYTDVNKIFDQIFNLRENPCSAVQTSFINLYKIVTLSATNTEDVNNFNYSITDGKCMDVLESFLPDFVQFVVSQISDAENNQYVIPKVIYHKKKNSNGLGSKSIRSKKNLDVEQSDSKIDDENSRKCDNISVDETNQEQNENVINDLEDYTSTFNLGANRSGNSNDVADVTEGNGMKLNSLNSLPNIDKSTTIVNEDSLTSTFDIRTAHSEMKKIKSKKTKTRSSFHTRLEVFENSIHERPSNIYLCGKIYQALKEADTMITGFLRLCNNNIQDKISISSNLMKLINDIFQKGLRDIPALPITRETHKFIKDAILLVSQSCSVKVTLSSPSNPSLFKALEFNQALLWETVTYDEHINYHTFQSVIIALASMHGISQTFFGSKKMHDWLIPNKLYHLACCLMYMMLKSYAKSEKNLSHISTNSQTELKIFSYIDVTLKNIKTEELSFTSITQKLVSDMFDSEEKCVLDKELYLPLEIFDLDEIPMNNLHQSKN